MRNPGGGRGEGRQGGKEKGGGVHIVRVQVRSAADNDSENSRAQSTETSFSEEIQTRDWQTSVRSPAQRASPSTTASPLTPRLRRRQSDAKGDTSTPETLTACPHTHTHSLRNDSRHTPTHPQAANPSQSGTTQHTRGPRAQLPHTSRRRTTGAAAVPSPIVPSRARHKTWLGLRSERRSRHSLRRARRVRHCVCVCLAVGARLELVGWLAGARRRGLADGDAEHAEHAELPRYRLRQSAGGAGQDRTGQLPPHQHQHRLRHPPPPASSRIGEIVLIAPQPTQHSTRKNSSAGPRTGWRFLTPLPRGPEAPRHE